MYRKPMVPKDFKMPQEMSGEGYLLRPLTVDDLETDYVAVMNNVDMNGKHVDYSSHTKKQNLIDLGYHQKEMQKGASFTYMIADLSGENSLGCIYIYPSDNPHYDAEISYWLIKEAEGLYSTLEKDVKQWLNDSWPFEKVFFVK